MAKKVSGALNEIGWTRCDRVSDDAASALLLLLL
jgi:hypothetical protein